VQLGDAPDDRGALLDGLALAPAGVRLRGPPDGSSQVVVGDRVVGLERLPGGGVDDGVVGHGIPGSIDMGG
jgi:hypothetical protein